MVAQSHLQLRVAWRSTKALSESRLSALLRGMGPVVHELRIRQDIQRLADYDDAMLRDIGLARADIESALRSGRSRHRPEDALPHLA